MCIRMLEIIRHKRTLFFTEKCSCWDICTKDLKLQRILVSLASNNIERGREKHYCFQIPSASVRSLTWYKQGLFKRKTFHILLYYPSGFLRPDGHYLLTVALRGGALLFQVFIKNGESIYTWNNLHMLKKKQTRKESDYNVFRLDFQVLLSSLQR